MNDIDNLYIGNEQNRQSWAEQVFTLAEGDLGLAQWVETNNLKIGKNYDSVVSPANIHVLLDSELA